jgi:NAD(P)H-binding
MELVTGATGYVGELLVRRLSREGRPIRALARDASRLEPLDGVEAAEGDLLTGAGLERALDGCASAYYLVHSMEAAGDNGFADRDRRAAEAFARAAAAAGVERVVYLGGIAPVTASRHLGSRLEVERILLDAVPGSTALRASIVIGAGSSSFRILARTPATPAAAGRSLDVVGPDVVSYAQMMERIADLMGVGRMPLGLRASLTPPASAVVAAMTGQPLELVRPLMESLESDILPRDSEEAARIYGIRPRRFERAVEHALAEWESREPLAAR